MISLLLISTHVLGSAVNLMKSDEQTSPLFAIIPGVGLLVFLHSMHQRHFTSQAQSERARTPDFIMQHS